MTHYLYETGNVGIIIWHVLVETRKREGKQKAGITNLQIKFKNRWRNVHYENGDNGQFFWLKYNGSVHYIGSNLR